MIDTENQSREEINLIYSFSFGISPKKMYKRRYYRIRKFRSRIRIFFVISIEFDLASMVSRYTPRMMKEIVENSIFARSHYKAIPVILNHHDRPVYKSEILSFRWNLSPNKNTKLCWFNKILSRWTPSRMDTGTFSMYAGYWSDNSTLSTANHHFRSSRRY